MEVCFFGAFDPVYPRNRILRDGLRKSGVVVQECRVPDSRAFRRYPALVGAFARQGRKADVLLVPEFRHKDVPLARMLRGHRPLVFDPLISRHDTLVHDWKLHAEDSAQARWNLGWDRWSLSLADLVLCDTWAHGDLYQSLGTPRERLRRVLVGAEDAFFAVGPPPTSPVRIVYVGGFLPLHGVPLIVEAAAELERRGTGLPEFRIDLFGRGIELDQVRSLAARLGVKRLEVRGPLDYADLPRTIEASHVVLGAFGASDKAGRVIPHKVYQGLAAGRAVVTGDGPGVREVFEPGVHLCGVPRGDSAALAESLARLIQDRDARERLGVAARARALEVATPQRIGEALLAALTEAAR